MDVTGLNPPPPKKLAAGREGQGPSRLRSRRRSEAAKRRRSLGNLRRLSRTKDEAKAAAARGSRSPRSNRPSWSSARPWTRPRGAIAWRSTSSNGGRRRWRSVVAVRGRVRRSASGQGKSRSRGICRSSSSTTVQPPGVPFAGDHPARVRQPCRGGSAEADEAESARTRRRSSIAPRRPSGSRAGVRSRST